MKVVEPRGDLLRCSDIDRGTGGVYLDCADNSFFCPKLDRQRASINESDVLIGFHILQVFAGAHRFYIGKPQ